MLVLKDASDHSEVGRIETPDTNHAEYQNHAVYRGETLRWLDTFYRVVEVERDFDNAYTIVYVREL